MHTPKPIFAARAASLLALLALVGALLLAPVARPAGAQPASSPTPTPPATLTPAPVDLSAMSLEDKVGQLFLITIYSRDLDQADRDLVAAMRPGGVVLFPMNISAPQQVAELVNALQAHGAALNLPAPVIVATDQEGGPVTRLRDGFTTFPTPMLLGATGSSIDAEQVGQAMGREMAAVGVRMNLAPVVDLTNPDRAHRPQWVLYRRTISSDPAIAGRIAAGLVRGMREADVIGVLKHYPGHGAATQDSHDELPHVDLSAERVRQNDLAAFAHAITGGTSAVMVGHLYYPALDPNYIRPATLSPVMLDLLRDELGFDGVTISDAMDMGAILRTYSMSGAVIESINAGMDMIAFGPHVTAADQQRVYNDVLAAARNGTISTARLDEAVGRIMALRAQHDLLAWEPLGVDSTAARLMRDAHRDVLLQAALDAVTVLDNPNGLLPVRADRSSVALIYPADKPALLSACQSLDPDLVAVPVATSPTSAEINAAVSAAENADRVIAVFDNVSNDGQQYNLAWSLPPRKTTAVLMGSPFDWGDLPVPLETVALTYDTIEAAQIAACHVLYGAAPARGQLPVPVGPYPVGAGVYYDALAPATSPTPTPQP